MTHLYPTGKFAELTLGIHSQRTTIRFRTNSKIEARFFPGRGNRAASFDRIERDILKIEHLPVLCLSIPLGYFKDAQTMLKEKFRVQCDDKPAGGKWENVPAGADGNEKECFIWNWGRHPFVEVPPGVYRGFNQMAQSARSPDLKGYRTFSIESSEVSEFGVIYKEYGSSRNGVGKNRPRSAVRPCNYWYQTLVKCRRVLT